MEETKKNISTNTRKRNLHIYTIGGFLILPLSVTYYMLRGEPKPIKQDLYGGVDKPHEKIMEKYRKTIAGLGLFTYCGMLATGGLFMARETINLLRSGGVSHYGQEINHCPILRTKLGVSLFLCTYLSCGCFGLLFGVIDDVSRKTRSI